LFAQKKKQKKGTTRTKSFESSIIRHNLDSNFQMISRSAWTPHTRTAFSLIKEDVCQPTVGA